MGVVYKARQVRLNRLCALKMILDSDQATDLAMQRFESEAEIVARLKNPNVVQIHAIGDHEGKPYVELELAEGGSLSQLLDGSPWDPKSAATLVRTVAQALHEVHNVGVVHRDLKPGNILLDRDRSPKISDFGLAKQLSTDSGLTRSDAIVGSPSYMAPEQASAKNKDVGPAADIHALGVILYELLVGRTPFKGANVVETLELVRSAEPVPPSRLAPGIARDLETIVLKCLRKEPENRYTSADELSNDLDLYLKGEPVRARRVGFVTRVSMWCRRKPWLAGLSAALLLTFVAGAVGVVVQWRKAQENYDLSRRRLHLALEAISRFHSGVSEELMLKQKGMEPLRDQLLGAAKSFYEKLGRDLKDDPSPSAKADLADAYSELSRITLMIGSRKEASAHLKRALDLREGVVGDDPKNLDQISKLASDYHRLGDSRFHEGDFEAAEESYRKAGALFGRITSLAPSSAINQADSAALESSRARLLDAVGKRDEAAKLYENSIRAYKRLEKEASYESRYPYETAYTLYHLGDLFQDMNEFQKAISRYDEAAGKMVNLLEKRPKSVQYRRAMGAILNSSGNAYRAINQYQEARKRYRQAIAYRKALSEELPGQVELLMDLSTSRANLGGTYFDPGDKTASDSLWQLEEALRLREQVCKLVPDVPDYRRMKGESHHLLGRHRYLYTSDRSNAQASFERALDILRSLVREHPGDTSYQETLAECVGNFAQLLYGMGEPKKALPYLDEAIGLMSRLVDKRRIDQRFLSELGKLQNAKAAARVMLGEIDQETIDAFKRAQEINQRLVEQNPKFVLYKTESARSSHGLGKLYRLQGRLDLARNAFANAVEAQRSVLADDLEIVYNLACMLSNACSVEDEPSRKSKLGNEAMDMLRRTIALGFVNLEHFQRDPDLNGIRVREDFKALMLDLAFPTKPFQAR